MIRAIAFGIVFAASAWAQAELCLDELRRAVPGGDTSVGQVAAAVLARAVQLVEPAYPELRGGDGPIEGAGAATEAVTYLYRRRLLPSGWTPQEHTPEAWAVMLARFTSGYRVEAPSVSGGDRSTMIAEAAATLADVADAVRPLPVFAVDDDGRVTFFAVIWNWTPVPRLLVYRPPSGVRLADSASSIEAARPVLDAMGSCAVRYDLFLYAREDQALRLFVAQGSSTLRVMAAEPPATQWPATFGTDAVVDVLTFRSDAVDGARTLSVAIDGPTPSFGSVFGVLLQVRTNVGLDAAFRVLALP